MKTLLKLFCIVCILAGSSRLLFSQAGERTTFAVLATQDVTEDGVTDLLTVKLSAHEDVQLVERAEIDKIMQERELSAMFDPANVGLRLELGKILAADRLFVLRKSNATSQGLEFLVIDTRSASILFRGQFDRYEGATGEMIDALSEIVANNVQNFRGGIKAVIAIPPFLSTGVEPNAEAYQSQFSEILSAALMRQPGVAVVSFEELEAIRRELDFSSQELRRVVPLVVQGEFLPKRTRDTGDGNGFLFDLSVKISDHGGIRSTVGKNSLTLRQAVELVAVEAPGSVFSLLEGSPFQAMSLDEQESVFAESAERFHRYGMYRLAQKQREAAILINPRNLFQRLSWIEEFYILQYDRRIAKGRDKVFTQLDYIVRNKLVTKSQGVSLFMKFYCDIPSYWIKENGTLMAVGDDEHAYYVPYVGLKHFFPMLCELPYDDEMPLADEEELLPFFKPTHDTRPGFSFINVMRFQHPDREMNLSRNDQDARLLDILYVYVIECNVPQYQDESIDYLQENILNFPECWTVPDTLFSHHLPSPGDLNYRYVIYQKFLQRNADRWAAMKTAMADSGREDLLFVKRFLDHFDADGKNQHTGDAKQRLDHAVKLQNELREKKLDAKTGTLNRCLDYAVVRLEASIARDERKERELEEIIAKTKDVRSEHLLKLPLQLPVEGDINVDAAFSVVPVPQWTEGADVEAFYRMTGGGKTVATTNFHKILIPAPHDDEYDIAWNADCVFLCRMENGRLVRKPVYTDTKKYSEQDGNITRVRSDGRLLWIVAKGEIHCVDADGKRIADFNAACGLPDSRINHSMNDHSVGQLKNNLGHWNHELALNTRYVDSFVLSVFPLGDGEAIAFGRSGDTMKTWVAKLALDENDRPQVKVLLNAPRDMGVAEIEKPGVVFDPANNDLIFNVPWVLKMDDPLFPERRQVLLGRVLKENHTAPPFLIDLDTDEIMPVTQRYPDLASLMGMQEIAYNNGHFVAYRGFGVYSFDRDEDGEYRMTEHKITYPNERREYAIEHIAMTRSYCCNLVSLESGIYLTGPDWYRFDCANPQGVPLPEKIAGTIVPDNNCFRRFAKTANFGLCSHYDIGFHLQGSPLSGRLYRFDFAKPTSESFSPYTRYVPDELLEKHCAAVAELESLGAIVTGVGSNRIKKFFAFPEPAGLHDCTYVVIDKSWKGTGKDFQKIADLYQPQRIYFYDVELTDDYFHALDRIDEQRLYFINAEFTCESFERFDVSKARGMYFIYPSGEGPADELISAIVKPREDGSEFSGQIQASPHLFPTRREETFRGSIKLIIDARPESYLE